MNKLTLEEALPMYIKLKKVMMNNKKQTELPLSKRTLESVCRKELEKIKPYATFYGYAGICLCIYINKGNTNRLPQIDLYVEKQYRNYGYELEMLNFCKGLNDILYVNVYSTNTKAIKLYTSQGFKTQQDDGDIIRLVWNKPHYEFDFSSLVKRLYNIK